MRNGYFGYIRVSTKKQGDGASLGEQRAAIEAFARKNSLTVTRWFCEMQTAAKAGRREFNEMLREAKRGGAHGVIIHKVDRSARNGHDWAALCDLIDLGIEVRFAHDDLDITTRGGRLTADIQAVIAADFIRNNREVVKLNMRGWLKQGFYPWGAPPGYLNNGKHKLKTIDPVRGSLVAQGFELYDTGLHGLDTLRRELARRGLVGTVGKPLSRGTMAYILRNPFYYGLIRMGSGEVYEGKHEPLITKRLFDRVQARLDGRVFAREAQPEFRFRRLIRCAACPRALTAERQRGHAYYRCHTLACRGLSFSEASVDENWVLPALEALRFDDGELADIRTVIDELQQTDLANVATRTESAERDLANVADRLQRLTDAMLDGIIDRDTFVERKAALLGERIRLTEIQQDGDRSFWPSIIERFEQGSVALDQYRLATDEKKRALLISLGSNIVARPNELELSMDFPFSAVISWRGVQDCAHARTQVRTCRRSRGEIAQFLIAIRMMHAAAP